MTASALVETAAVRAAAAAADAPLEILSFRIGAEHYGIDIQQVQEIRSYEAPTRIAGATGSLQGVLHLRGEIVPVIDLRQRFGAPQHYDSATVTVVLNVGGRTVGAVVDAVSDVVGLAPEQVRPVPPFHAAVDARHLRGVCLLDSGTQQRLLMLVDLERLLDGTAAV